MGLSLHKCQSGPGAERWTSQGCHWTSASPGLDRQYATPIETRLEIPDKLLKGGGHKAEYTVLMLATTHTGSDRTKLWYRISSTRSRVSYTSWVCNTSRGQTSFVPIEAGSKGEYTARLVGLPGISFCSIKYKTKNLGVLNICSSVNRVVLIQAGSLIEAGGLILLFY